MIRQSKTDKEIRESSKRAFVELFRLLLESGTQEESEPTEDYKDNEKKDEYSNT